MKVLLVFKNPSRPLNDTFELECSVVTSIGELKQTLQGVYPGKPLPEAITVSFETLESNSSNLSFRPSIEPF